MARTTTSSTSRRSSGGSSGRPTAKKTAPASTASRRASSTTAAARQQTEQAAGQAQERARQTVRDQLGERSNQAGDQLAGTAHDVRQIASQLREQDNEAAARLAELAADRVQRAGTYLSESDPDALLSDLERLARSQPLLTAGVAAAVGFVAARALSASSRQRNGGGYVDTSAGSDIDESDVRRTAGAA